MDSGAALTHDQILALAPGDKITVIRRAFDGSPLTREGTVLATSQNYGFYYVAQHGMWSLYAKPEEVESGRMAPACAVPLRWRGKRKAEGLLVTDASQVYKGWAT